MAHGTEQAGQGLNIKERGPGGGPSEEERLSSIPQRSPRVDAELWSSVRRCSSDRR
jgi:hypothetical protein